MKNCDLNTDLPQFDDYGRSSKCQNRSTEENGNCQICTTDKKELYSTDRIGKMGKWREQN